MSKMGGVLVVILSLIAGVGGGWAYESMIGSGGTSTTQESSSTASDDTASTQSLEDCLKETWGDDKYAALSANSSLATTEDNFLALACYEAK